MHKSYINIIIDNIDIKNIFKELISFIKKNNYEKILELFNNDIKQFNTIQNLNKNNFINFQINNIFIKDIFPKWEHLINLIFIEIKPEIKPEIKSEIKPEIKSEIKPEIKSEIKKFNIINLYTDGSAINNGKRNCKATFGFIIVNINIFNIRDISNDIILYKYKNSVDINPSSPRAELQAVVEGLFYILNNIQCNNINIITDSEYVFKTSTKWIYDWQKKNKIMKMKHPDLLVKLIDILFKFKNNKIDLNFIHINSHQNETNIIDKDYKNYYYNKMIDELI